MTPVAMSLKGSVNSRKWPQQLACPTTLRTPRNLDYITAALYRREAFQTAGLFDHELGFGEDGEWFTQARRYGLKIYTSEPSDDVWVPRDEHSPGKVPA